MARHVLASILLAPLLASAAIGDASSQGRKLRQLGGDRGLGNTFDNFIGYTTENTVGGVTNAVVAGSGCNNEGIGATSDPCSGGGGGPPAAPKAPATKAAVKKTGPGKYLLQFNKVAGAFTAVGNAGTSLTKVKAVGTGPDAVADVLNTEDGPLTGDTAQVVDTVNKVPGGTTVTGADDSVNNVVSPALNNAVANQPKVFSKTSGSTGSASGTASGATKGTGTKMP